jgi:hypothetical protein
LKKNFALMNVATDTWVAVVALVNGLCYVGYVCVFVYLFVYVCVCLFTCVCVCVCVREREREDWSFRLKVSLVIGTDGNRF